MNLRYEKYSTFKAKQIRKAKKYKEDIIFVNVKQNNTLFCTKYMCLQVYVRVGSDK